ncbi:hypothetical protein [Alloactinosynnema sp. L-07]|nr:hypothetical protein [Alloactinosynnema sp. L-07]
MSYGVQRAGVEGTARERGEDLFGDTSSWRARREQPREHGEDVPVRARSGATPEQPRERGEDLRGP